MYESGEMGLGMGKWRVLRGVFRVRNGGFRCVGVCLEGEKVDSAAGFRRCRRNFLPLQSKIYYKWRQG